MYQAKAQGPRSRASRSTAERCSPASRWRTTSAARSTRDELYLAFQPIVDLETGALRAAEALLRWNHPHHGNVSPGEFIPLAEETGLIVPIGAWVLEEACRTAADWDGGLPVTVNVSSVQLRSAEFLDTVAAALRRLRPARAAGSRSRSPRPC